MNAAGLRVADGNRTVDDMVVSNAQNCKWNRLASAVGGVKGACGIAHRTRRGLRRGPWQPEATQQRARGSRGPAVPAAAAAARAVGAAPETVAVEPAAAAGIVAAAVEPVAAAGIAAAVAVAAARSSSLAAAPAAAAPPIPCNPKQSVRNRLYSTMKIRRLLVYVTSAAA